MIRPFVGTWRVTALFWSTRGRGSRRGVLVEELPVQPDHRLDGITRGQHELDDVDEFSRAIVERSDGTTPRPFPYTGRALR